MTIMHGKMLEAGRIIIPADARRAMGLEKGDCVVMELNGGELRIVSQKSALRRFQDELMPYAPKNGFVSDELIAERRVEALRE